MIAEKTTVDYRFEEARLKSYKEWPVLHISPASLAAAGFYYLGKDDRVTCFECKLSLWDWNEGDKPMGEHQRWRAECRFISQIPCGNVPIGVDPKTIPPFQPHDKPYGIEIRDAVPDCIGGHCHQACSTVGTTAEKLRKIRKPKHTQYLEYEARLESFATWPPGLAQSKESLATAGFFYTGKGDNVICHHCGAGWKEWKPTDTPWKLHAMWNPKCHFVITTKGIEFVNKITGRSVPPPSPTDTAHEPTPSQNYASALDRVRNLTDELNKYLEMTKDEKRSKTQKPSTSSSETQLDLVAINSVVNGNLCKCCRATNVMTLFSPCGHAIVCNSCSAAMNRCLSCKTTIQHKLQIVIVHQYFREKDMLVIAPNLGPK